jgi:Disulfide bond formation protein DsbB
VDSRNRCPGGNVCFSEGLGLVPCELWWVQRIFAYSLIVLIGIAALDDRPTVIKTAGPLAIGGALVASYHSYIQLAPPGGTCGISGGCSSVQYQFASVLAIPNLAVIAFVLVEMLTAGAYWNSE